MTRKRIVLAGAGYTLLLDGYPVAGTRWTGSERDIEAKAREWHGTGILKNIATGQQQPFLFETDSWHEREKRWDRPFEQVLLAIVEHGTEKFPEIKDRARFTEMFTRYVQQLITDATAQRDDPLPSIHIKPLELEPLLEAGIVETR